MGNSSSRTPTQEELKSTTDVISKKGGKVLEKVPNSVIAAVFVLIMAVAKLK